MKFEIGTKFLAHCFVFLRPIGKKESNMLLQNMEAISWSLWREEIERKGSFSRSLGFLRVTFRVCLVGWILGRMRERERERERENFFRGCLVEGRGGKKLVRPGCFLPGPTKIFSPQIGKRTWENKYGLKHPCAIAPMLLGFAFHFFFFFPFDM